MLKNKGLKIYKQNDIRRSPNFRENRLKSKKSLKNLAPNENGSLLQAALHSNRCINFDKRNNKHAVDEEYAIKNYESKQIRTKRAISASRPNQRYRHFLNKYEKKLQADAKEHSQQLRNKRSLSPRINSVGSSQSRSKANKGIRQKSIDTIKKSIKRPSIHFLVGPQRYIRISLQKIQSQKSQEYKEKIEELKKQAETYRMKYENSLKAINKMNNYIKTQRNKYELEKNVYEEKIRIMKAQIEHKNYQPDRIPHLFSYHTEKQIVPDSMILENTQENKGSSFVQVQKNRSSNIQQLENIMEDYLGKVESKSSSGMKSNLSLESK